MNRIRELREARGWSQAQLALAADTSQPQIDRLEKGERRLTEQWMRRLARVLEVEPAALLADEPAQPPAVLPRPDLDTRTVLTDGLVGDRDLPVYGVTEGGRFGAVSMSAEPIQWVRRPEPLARVPAGFGLYVAGESMEPAYRQGDIVLVHPSMPARRGDDVVLVQVDAHNDRHALLKRLVDWTAEHWTVRQFNPDEQFDLARDLWRWTHVVVGRYSRR